MDNDEFEMQMLEIEEKMDKAVKAAADALAKIRTGRAHPSMLEDIKVDYYGTLTPLKQLASLSAPDARTLTVTPFDPSSTKLIEKAIQQSHLGLTPNLAGDKLIRINLPDLTEERRKELVKAVKNDAEAGRVAVRNIRRDANELIKKAEKAKIFGEDDAKRKLEEVQKITDEHIKKIDDLVAKKEADLLKV